MWQHNNNFKNYVLKMHSGFSSSILDGVRSCHMDENHKKLINIQRCKT